MRPQLSVAFVSLVILALGFRAVAGPEERIAFLFYDDAYYYLGVAKHLGTGEGSTFDGLHATNGYHPLWCALLVPALAAYDDPGDGVRASAALWFLIAAAVPWAIWWAGRLRFGDRLAATAAVVFSTLPWLGMSLARPNGLETPLLALLVALVLGAADRNAKPAVLGLLAGLAILARLDAAFLAAALVLRTLRRDRKRAATIALATAIVAGPWLVWNTATFGHPMPVSGRVLSWEAEKARAAHGGALTIGNAVERARIALVHIPKRLVERALSGVPAAPFFGLSVIALLAIGLSRWRDLRLLLLFALLHFAAYAAWLWTPGEDVYRAYYFLPEAMLASFLAAAGVEAIFNKAHTKSVRAAFAIVAVVVLCTRTVAESNKQARALKAKPGPVASRFIYGWVKENTPPDAVLGARDAGKLGWFSGRRVVNLDGLVNDDEFLKALEADTVDAYICASPIDYLLYDRPYVATRLADAGACRVRDAGPATEEWVVLEVQRQF